MAHQIDESKPKYLSQTRFMSGRRIIKTSVTEITDENVVDVLRKALHRDTSISESVWSEEYTQEEFLQFVFHHLIVLLHAGHKNCDFFEKTLRKILY